MDEKDPNEEELNPQGQDDINDADDSFGLPDLEYKPLEDDSKESESEEPEAEESTPEESDTESIDNSEESTPDEEEESSYDSTQEESTEEYSYDSNDEETEDDESEEGEEEKSQMRYQLEEKSSNAPKIIGGIFVVLLVSVAIWYFGFYRIQQQELADAEKAKQELIDAQKAEEAAALKAKRDAEAAEAAEAARLAAEAEARAKAGVQILEERTDRYYIVLESFVDGDFAKDFGNKIAKEGTPSFLIPPYSKKKMQRVGIGGYESIDEAKAALNDLPDEFGTGKWILKY